MRKTEKLRMSPTEMRRLHRVSTKVYLKSVMQKVFRDRWEESLKKLLTGDRPTLDFCARQLNKNLDFFPLLHTLCLVTGQKFDLGAEDPAHAADAWLCWFEGNRERLEWNIEEELWKAN